MYISYIYKDFFTYIYLSFLFYSFTFSLTPSFSLFSHFSVFIVIIFSSCRFYCYVFFVVFPSWHSAQAQISGLLVSSVFNWSISFLLSFAPQVNLYYSLWNTLVILVCM